MIKTLRLQITETCEGFYIRTEPKRKTVFFEGREIRMIDLIPVENLSITEAGAYGLDEPDGWPLVYLNLYIDKPWIVDLLKLYGADGNDQIELRVNTGADGKWHLEGEVLRKLDVELIGGKPVLSVREARLEPLQLAA